jgi:flavin reductase (DIM6/NTAB) family NADH-FMN oxidoreductase RutF
VTSPPPLPAAPVPGGLVLPHELRATMRKHAAGVAVITTRGDGGEGGDGPVGFCATSLSSVSLEPPTVSFAVAVDSVSGRAWRTAAHGIVHLLQSDQEAVAATFARTGPDKFAGRIGWRWGPGGQPLLDNVLAWMLVSTRSRLLVGDHLLVVADVRQASVRPGPGPLIHCGGGFHGLPAGPD